MSAPIPSQVAATAQLLSSSLHTEDEAIVPGGRSPACSGKAGQNDAGFCPEEVEIWCDPSGQKVGSLNVRNMQRRWQGIQSSWDIGVIRGGAWTWRTGGTLQHVHAGCVALKEPGEAFKVESLDGPSAVRILKLDASWVERHISHKGYRLSRLMLPLRAMESLQENSEVVFRRIQAIEQATTPLERQTQICDLLDEVLVKVLEEPGARSLKKERRAFAIRDYIADNFRQNFSLDDLATVFDLHRVYLVRLFRRCFGIPPHAYQTLLRVEAALDLIEIGTPPADAATKVGFFDQSHLIRHCRTQLKVSPGAFVKRRSRMLQEFFCSWQRERIEQLNQSVFHNVSRLLAG